MDWLFALIVSTPEYQSFGWSLVFAGFVTTVVLTFGLQLPGLINQARTIWRNRSAEGVEMLTFIAFFTYFAVFLVYASLIHSGAGMLNAFILLPLQLFILWGVVRFKKLRIIDMLAAVGGATLLALIIALPEYKEKFFMITSVAVFVGLLLQPIEMFKTKTSANVAFSFPVNFAVVAAVWTIYGIAIDDWFLAGASGAFTAVYLLTIA